MRIYESKYDVGDSALYPSREEAVKAVEAEGLKVYE